MAVHCFHINDTPEQTGNVTTHQLIMFCMCVCVCVCVEHVRVMRIDDSHTHDSSLLVDGIQQAK